MTRLRVLFALLSAAACASTITAATYGAAPYTGPVTNVVYKPKDGTLPSGRVGKAYSALAVASPTAPTDATSPVMGCDSHKLPGYPPPQNFTTFHDCAKLPPGLKATPYSFSARIAEMKITGVPKGPAKTYYFDLMVAWKDKNGALYWGKRTFEITIK